LFVVVIVIADALAAFARAARVVRHDGSIYAAVAAMTLVVFTVLVLSEALDSPSLRYLEETCAAQTLADPITSWKYLGMLPDLQLRHLGRDEWQVLMSVRLNALRESPLSFLAKYDQEKEYSPKRWQTEFDRGDWIVGELDGLHVCLTGVTQESGAPKDECYLEYVWVAQDLRRRGTALGILRHIIGELKESGVRTVFLCILDGNDRARLLFKKLDFITTNQRQELQSDSKGRYEERLSRDLT
jgi:ribosomal protein S18 acetylase RimI-like enzyme